LDPRGRRHPQVPAPGRAVQCAHQHRRRCRAVAGLLQDTAEPGAVIGGLPREPEALGGGGCGLEMPCGGIEPVPGLGDRAEDRLAVHEAPRVTQPGQCADRGARISSRRREIPDLQRRRRAQQQVRGVLPLGSGGAPRDQLARLRGAALHQSQEGLVAQGIGAQAGVVETLGLIERGDEFPFGAVDVARRRLEPARQ